MVLGAVISAMVMASYLSSLMTITGVIVGCLPHLGSLLEGWK